MNAKKTPNLYWRPLDDGERHERLSTGNRLIACEKMHGEERGITLLVADDAGASQWAPLDQGLPVEQNGVLEQIRDSEGAVEIIVDTGCSWSAALGALFAALRDRANRRVVVHMGEARIGGAIDQQLVSLGYKRQARDEALYLFDIETYKDTPDWLNPRNWANPDMWDKYRW